MRARGRHRRVLVSRAVAPMAAVPVAGLAAAVCALAVLARDDGRARSVAAPRAEGRVRAREVAPREVALEPPRPTRAPAAPPRSQAATRRPADREAGAAPRDLDRAAAVMLDPLRPWPERLEAALTLGRARAVELLLGASTSPDEAVRGLSVVGLEVLLATDPQDPALLGALTRLVDDPAPDVAGRAAYALASSADGRRSLVSRLRGASPASLVHLACAEALMQRGTPDEVPALLDWAAVDGPVGEAAAAAVRAICARAGVESPLPPPEPPGEPRPPRE